MLPPRDRADTHDALCPHCKQAFRAERLDGGFDRYQGFKCPHCKLFVPLDRADVD